MKKIIILILILTSYKAKSQCLSGDCNDGYGKYQYDNGGVYQGNFKNGLENGSGTLIFASGAKYIGEFYNGKKNGKGIYYYTSGEIQDGDFVNGIFVNGKDKLASGDTYIGEFLNGVWNGNGTYIWADGEKYVGGFKNGVFHGMGKKYLVNGTIVEGEWSNGTMIKKTAPTTASTNTIPSEAINCELARKKYLEQNPDVAKASMDAWNHYTTFGKREGRKWPACAENANNNIQELTESNTKPLEAINCELARKKYLEQNPDVAKAGMDAWNHYTSYGKREGRKWPECSPRIELSESQKIIYSKAMEESEKGNLNSSLDYFNQLISQSPNYFPTYILIAGIKGQLHQYSQAVSDVDIFIKNSTGYEPLLANAYRLKGAVLIALDKLDEGCKYLSLAIDKGDTGAKKDFETLCNQKNKPIPAVSNSVCSFVFKKPILTITYVDNRTMCCYCNKRYAQYSTSESAASTEAIAYLGEELYLHFKNSNANEQHQQQDLDRFQKFVAENYSILASYGVAFSVKLAEMLDISGERLCSKNRNVKRYNIKSKFCSSECEDRCSYSQNCKCN
jgi:hypothetical protein